MCGGGLSKYSACYKDVCKEVVDCYESMCSQLLRDLSRKDSATEEARQNAMTQRTGEWYRYPQMRFFQKRLCGLSTDGILDPKAKTPAADDQRAPMPTCEQIDGDAPMVCT